MRIEKTIELDRVLGLFKKAVSGNIWEIGVKTID